MINVTYKVVSSKWHINKVLEVLNEYEILGFDTEVAGVYSKAERKEATVYLKGKDLPVNNKAIALQIEANSGLSYPSLTNVTHFIFGISDHSSIIIICTNPQLEIFLWDWVSKFKGLLLIHNTLFDLKIMYHRVGKFPVNYEDTQLLAKCLTNDVEVWKAKVDLKSLMGSHYDPTWALYNKYEPDNLKDKEFLDYMSIDGAAVYKLWFDIQESIGG